MWVCVYLEAVKLHDIDVALLQYVCAFFLFLFLLPFDLMGGLAWLRLVPYNTGWMFCFFLFLLTFLVVVVVITASAAAAAVAVTADDVDVIKLTCQRGVFK